MYQTKKSNRKAKSHMVEGKYYDSKKEAGEAEYLHELLEKGEIKSFKGHVPIDFYIRPGENEQGIIVIAPEDRHTGGYLDRYYVDFEILHNDGTTEYLEVKGLQGQDFKRKWQMMDAVLGNSPNIQLTIIF